MIALLAEMSFFFALALVLLIKAVASILLSVKERRERIASQRFLESVHKDIDRRLEAEERQRLDDWDRAHGWGRYR